MRKKLKDEKDKEQEAVSEPSTPTSPEPVAVRENTDIEITDKVAEVKKLDRLSLGFPNEDLNKLVAKINEIIDKIND